MTDDAIIDRIKSKEAAAKRALKELRDSIATCDDLEFLAFLATDTTLTDMAVEHRMNAERELGKLLNESACAWKARRQASSSTKKAAA